MIVVSLLWRRVTWRDGVGARPENSRRRHSGAYRRTGVLQIGIADGKRSGVSTNSGAASDPQVARLDLFVAQELVRAGLVDDLALAHEVDVVGDAEGEGEVLLDDQDGRAPGLEPAQNAPELSHQERREPLRGLVHQENVGVAHQRPPAGEHLLLAAGELVAAVPEALAQPREELEHPIEAPAGAVAGALADLEMLADTERREDAPALRDQPHAPAGDLVRSETRDVLAAQEDAPSPRRREADDGADESRLAHPVATEDGHDLPLAQAQGQTLQDIALPVVRVDVLDLKHHRRSRGRWRRPPDRSGSYPWCPRRGHAPGRVR